MSYSPNYGPNYGVGRRGGYKTPAALKREKSCEEIPIPLTNTGAALRTNNRLDCIILKIFRRTRVIDASTGAARPDRASCAKYWRQSEVSEHGRATGEKIAMPAGVVAGETEGIRI